MKRKVNKKIKKQRAFTIRMPSNLASELDSLRKKRGATRNAFLIRMIEEYLNESNKLKTFMLSLG